MVYYYREENSSNYRIWNDKWGGDQFEVVTEEEFKQIQEVFKRFSIAIIEDSCDD